MINPLIFKVVAKTSHPANSSFEGPTGAADAEREALPRGSKGDLSGSLPSLAAILDTL